MRMSYPFFRDVTVRHSVSGSGSSKQRSGLISRNIREECREQVDVRKTELV